MIVLTKEHRSGGEFMYFYTCPKCNFRYVVFASNYCPGCGKKLKWQEMNFFS